ncbi:MAG: hypothetical protein KBG28_03605 [Kofleriaceae bacterium]|jgi:hypothetical protein|nr:hypothetical protein [Kofleriaceae bacterium]MBP6838585.1 hypothetical protein [Kofleriaceae bacterium]MBP9203047.1 hypothetical protein [Kofleriaceae bacterium]
MVRTFVQVELVGHDDVYATLWNALGPLGFSRTITGRKTGKEFRLPVGLYAISKPADEALALTKQAVASGQGEARIFCIPAGKGVRFGNLQDDDEAAEDEVLTAPIPVVTKPARI